MKIRHQHRFARYFASPAAMQFIEQLALTVASNPSLASKVSKMSSGRVGAVVKAAIRRSRHGT